MRQGCFMTQSLFALSDGVWFSVSSIRNEPGKTGE